MRNNSCWMLCGLAVAGVCHGASVAPGATGPSGLSPQAKASDAAAEHAIIVAADGSGKFRTVQAAVDSVPDRNHERAVIVIKPGVYKERITVSQRKPYITFRGEEAEKTVLTFDCSANKTGPDGKPFGTSGSPSVFINADEFTAEDVTFENSSGQGAGQAVAVKITGDRCVFRRCRFLGWQDTLYAHGNGRQYFKDCYIEGHCDFIFGNAAAVFENCRICSKASGYVTAQGRDTEDAPTGYVFVNCDLTATTDTARVFLGRPWRPYARVVFIGCKMGAHIRPEGWDNWGKAENEATAWFGEYNSSGPGANPKARAPWSRQLTKDESEEFDARSFLARDDGWDPEK